MEKLSVILILAGIIQIITLIVFFVMAGNISAIKKELTKSLETNDYIEKSNEEKFIGNKEKAEEWLLRAIYHLNKSVEEVKNNSPEYLLEGHINSVNRRIEKINTLINDLKSS